MDIIIEKFFTNFSFLFLFFSMLIYWIQVSFFPSSGNAVTNTNSLTIKNTGYFEKNLGIISMSLANLFLIILLISRWKISGHFPLSNLYESLLFLSWSLTCIHLILNIWTKNNFIAAITAPSPLFTYAFATFSLPKEMQEASSLIPALQSNWLMMHVTVMVLSYAALLFGSLMAIAFLILSQEKNFQTPIFLYNNSKDSKLLNENTQKFDDFLQILDNLSYRILGIGFPFLTIGILSGAVWANEAWGSYWSWDPKETWALITWFIFAIYLHTRLTKGWTGKKPAIIASLGFLTVWMCFLGVNLLGEGLHSYGWFQKS
uniref:Cytochrome c biogenesis protein CcsA n=1 Tax=Treubaria triappendiculata TaxID=1755147 RepID=A0A0S2LMJ8_TRETR|nr:heme attachment to plastid cytochrome c [Treubaria triappendiculata]ALO62621.1 heme attachment to plastid cytochrome c [Treubaria triappendiculata]